MLIKSTARQRDWRAYQYNNRLQGEGRRMPTSFLPGTRDGYEQVTINNLEV